MQTEITITFSVETAQPLNIVDFSTQAEAGLRDIVDAYNKTHVPLNSDVESGYYGTPLDAAGDDLGAAVTSSKTVSITDKLVVVKDPVEVI